MKTILFQGDSVTDAGRSYEDENNLGSGYATLAAGEIKLDYPGQYRIINKGISGNRVVDLYARMKADMINIKPDIMSILIGVNDVWHELMFQNGVAAEKFYKVYDMLIGELKEALPDLKIMILEPFILKACATEGNWDVFRSEVEKRAEAARRIAEKYQLIFVPLQEKFNQAVDLAPESYWLSDGVHPTAAGHEIIKRAWMEKFREI